MVMGNRAAIFGALMLTLVAAPALGQNVKTEKNGEAEVRYSDGCVVYYGKSGRRMDSRPGCSASQNRRADEAMAAYSRQHGRGGDGQYGRAPEVIVDRQGAGRVEFANDCVVRYDREGHRKALSRCTNDEIRWADRAMANSRRDQRAGNSFLYGEGGQQRDCPSGSPVGLGDHAWSRCGY
jgi:hypothetical protein